MRSGSLARTGPSPSRAAGLCASRMVEMGGLFFWVAFVAALGGVAYGGIRLAAKLAPRSARLTSRNAQRALSALPSGSGEPVGFARGFSGNISLPALLAYSSLTYTLMLLPLPLFLRRHPPVELVATPEGIYTVRQRHPILGGRARLLESRASRSDLSMVKRWRHGSTVVALGTERHMLFPGHYEKLVGPDGASTT